MQTNHTMTSKNYHELLAKANITELPNEPPLWAPPEGFADQHDEKKHIISSRDIAVVAKNDTKNGASPNDHIELPAKSSSPLPELSANPSSPASPSSSVRSPIHRKSTPSMTDSRQAMESLPIDSHEMPADWQEGRSTGESRLDILRARIDKVRARKERLAELEGLDDLEAQL